MNGGGSPRPGGTRCHAARRARPDGEEVGRRMLVLLGTELLKTELLDTARPGTAR
ncbi:hypothetical protein [Promicromonospora iranensis]|uniref:Uncharacterized protein n=1 Tax=Promicromonospora iranensis TaxID=1105144 RepID=A0ABU2CH22_9MICO|nr:hypothetical protein [Promicromonospora iranensis]MDR7380634.1 hypothetical protein [Promicromonospora iranensis]